VLNGKFFLICTLFFFDSDLHLGRPYTTDEEFLKAPDDGSPYCKRIEFEVAKFAFKKCHMSAKHLDFLCDLMAASLTKHHDTPPFADHKDLYNFIDATQLGDVPWQSFSVQYTGEHPEVVPLWMNDEFEVWYRDPRAMAYSILANPTFKDEINYAPFHEYNASDDICQWKDCMSGDWAWQQAVCFLPITTGISWNIANISFRTPYQKIQRHMDLR
jgi:hypothetical protein